MIARAKIVGFVNLVSNDSISITINIEACRASETSNKFHIDLDFPFHPPSAGCSL